MKKTSRTILLIANGDLRQSANEATWQAQAEMEAKLTGTLKSLGYKLVRAHPYKKDLKHGFIGSQKEGMEVFARINPKTPVIVPYHVPISPVPIPCTRTRKVGVHVERPYPAKAMNAEPMARWRNDDIRHRKANTSFTAGG